MLASLRGPNRTCHVILRDQVHRSGKQNQGLGVSYYPVLGPGPVDPCTGASFIRLGLGHEHPLGPKRLPANGMMCCAAYVPRGLISRINFEKRVAK